MDDGQMTTCCSRYIILIYTDDLDDTIASKVLKFADYTKVFTEIKIMEINIIY